MSPRRSVHRTQKRSYIIATALLVVLGIVLRIGYVSVTDTRERQNDVDGHIEYVHYVAEHWTIPPAGEGWQYYQPPQYYFLTAPIAVVCDSLSYCTDEELRTLLQLVSLLFSIIVLWLCVWIAALLFPKDTDSEYGKRLLFIGCISVFPGLILASGRINNDALASVYMFAFVGALLKWYRTDATRWWVAAIFCSALAILTKSNGLLLPAIAFLSLATVSWRPTLRTLRLGIIGVIILAHIALWYPFMRMTMDDQAKTAADVAGTPAAVVISNLTNLNSHLRVENTIRNYVTFNPIAFVAIPFNNSWDDAFRRQYFFEYFYRSMFFGEYGFDDRTRLLASHLLFAGLAVLLLALFGLVQSMRMHDPNAMPLLIIATVILGGHVLLRIFAPYGPIQDFRYSPLLLVPLFAYMALAAMTQRKALRISAIGIIMIFCYLCAIFTGSIVLLEV